MTGWKNFFDLWLKTAACCWVVLAAEDEGNYLSLRQLGNDRQFKALDRTTGRADACLVAPAWALCALSR